jgi:p-aminobenzoyl-glutamate transporter AbgT
MGYIYKVLLVVVVYYIVTKLIIPFFRVYQATGHKLKEMQQKMNDMEQRMNPKQPLGKKGDYIDYEEVK